MSILTRKLIPLSAVILLATLALVWGSGGAALGAASEATSVNDASKGPTLPTVQVERVFPNLTFSGLTNLVQPDDGQNRIFVTELVGRIRVFPDTQQATEARIFLNITDRVEDNQEEGLLGLAFDPD